MKFGLVRSPSVSHPYVRQTVLNGTVDSNGFPNALSVGSGLAVTLTATGTAFLLSFAAGFDSNGAIDYLTQFTANQSFSSLTAASTCFLYVDRNPSTGALATGFTTIAPVYQTVAPTPPATGQHWFDLSAFMMKRWSGSAWIVLQRVFVGECVVGASTVTTVTNYAYRGFYQSAWVAVVALTNYNFNHQLGMSLAAASANISVFTSIAGNDTDATVAVQVLLFQSQYYGYQQRRSLTATRTLQISTQAFVAQDSSNTWQTTGFYKITVSRGW